MICRVRIGLEAVLEAFIISFQELQVLEILLEVHVNAFGGRVFGFSIDIVRRSIMIPLVMAVT
jgi:hypothetical protein